MSDVTAAPKPAPAPSNFYPAPAAAPSAWRQKLTSEIEWAAARLREPSTYLGVAGLFLACHLAPADATADAQLVEAVGILAGSIAGIVMPEAAGD